MRAWIAVGAVLAGANLGFGQAVTPTVPIGPGPVSQPSGVVMPGTNVGTTSLKPVGSQFPNTLPKIGNPIGTAPGTQPFSSPASTLPGGNFDPKSVVGPLPPSTFAPKDETAWDKFVKRFGDSLGFIAPQPKSPVWVPGLARRNRERAEERWYAQWRRD